MITPASPPDSSAADGGYDHDSLPVGYYDEVFNRRRGVHSKWHHLKFARFRREMVGFCDHLNIGCGPGTFIGTLPEEHQSVGIDIAPGQIEYANLHYGAENRTFRSVAPGEVPFDDQSFDVVTMIELIEHPDAAQINALLGQARRVLRPGGRLLVSTPNYRSAWLALEILVRVIGRVSRGKRHINRFDRDRLGETLYGAGFARIEICGYMLVAPFAAFLGWRPADRIARLEPAKLVDRFGLLLIASAVPAR